MRFRGLPYQKTDRIIQPAEDNLSRDNVMAQAANRKGAVGKPQLNF